MELVLGIHNLRPRHYGCVLTIGNFDGFHRGHQFLLTKLKTEGYYRNLPVIVMMFEPQPQEYFIGKAAPARLSYLRDKVKYLSDAGVDVILCVTFNKLFAELDAASFVKNILVKKLGVRLINIGNDFCFGAKRKGNYAMLQQLGKIFNFEVMSITSYTENSKRISSTAIRKMLEQDRLIEAELLLGHSYRFSGRVIHNDKLGRTIGFPTANISLKKHRIPINGVYIVKVYGVMNKILFGVANVGIRPTLAGLHQQLEVHLLDVSIKIYGIHIEVIFLLKLRNEQKFSSLNDLKKQITNDVLRARKYFLQMKSQHNLDNTSGIQ